MENITSQKMMDEILLNGKIAKKYQLCAETKFVLNILAIIEFHKIDLKNLRKDIEENPDEFRSNYLGKILHPYKSTDKTQMPEESL